MGAKQVIFKYANRAVRDAQQTGMGVHDGIARLHCGHIQWMMDTINKQEAQLHTLAQAVLEAHRKEYYLATDQDGAYLSYDLVECQCEACTIAREVLK